MARRHTAPVPRKTTTPASRVLRPQSAQRPTPPAPTRPLPAPPPTGAPDDPVVLRLTAQAKALLSDWNGGDARTRVALGGVLNQVRTRLDHGHWLGWLEETVPFTPRSALNYIELASWAQAKQAVFEQIAPLGASKVYLLSRLPPPVLEQLLAKRDHQVPGTNRRTTLSLMKYSDFMKLVLQATRPAAPPTDPMVVLLGDARSNVNRTVKLIKLLIANKTGLDQDAVEDLHDDLVVALQKLSAAFKLD